MVLVKMPNPARKTVLLSLNGRNAILMRGSKSCQYVCPRLGGKPAWLARHHFGTRKSHVSCRERNRH